MRVPKGACWEPPEKRHRGEWVGRDPRILHLLRRRWQPTWTIVGRLMELRDAAPFPAQAAVTYIKVQ